MSTQNVMNNIQVSEQNGKDVAQQQLSELKHGNQLLTTQISAFSSINLALQQMLTAIKPLTENQQSLRIANTAMASNSQFKDVSTYLQFADRHGASQEEALQSYTNVKKDLFDIRDNKQKLEQNPMIKELAAQNKDLYEQLKNTNNMSDFFALITENLSKAKQGHNIKAMQAASDYFKSNNMLAAYTDSMIKRPTQEQLSQSGNDVGQAELRKNPYYNMTVRAEAQQLAYDKTIGTVQNLDAEVRQRTASDNLVANSVFQATAAKENNISTIDRYNSNPKESLEAAYKGIVSKNLEGEAATQAIKSYAENIGKLFGVGEQVSGASELSIGATSYLRSIHEVNKRGEQLNEVADRTSKLSPEEEQKRILEVTRSWQNEDYKHLIKVMREEFGVDISRNQSRSSFIMTKRDGKKIDIGSDLKVVFTDKMVENLQPDGIRNMRRIEELTGMKFDIGNNPGFNDNGWAWGPGLKTPNGDYKHFGSRVFQTPSNEPLVMGADYDFEQKVKKNKEKKEHDEHIRQVQIRNNELRKLQDLPSPYFNVGLGSNQYGGALRSFYQSDVFRTVDSTGLASPTITSNSKESNGLSFPNLASDIKKTFVKLDDFLQAMKQNVAQDRAVHNNQHVTITLNGLSDTSMKGWMKQNLPSLMNGSRATTPAMSSDAINTARGTR